MNRFSEMSAKIMHWSDCRFSFDCFKYLACFWQYNDDD
jgi:hypothetical protein